MTTIINKTTGFYVKFISVHGLNALKHYSHTVDNSEKQTIEKAIAIYKNNIVEASKKTDQKKEPANVNEWFIGLANSASERLVFAEYLADKLCISTELFFWKLNNPGSFTSNDRLILEKQAGRKLKFDK